MSHGNRNFRQCKRLFAQQEGRCHYCKEQMTMERPGRHQKPAPNMATIEHLDDRYDPKRGSYAGQKRHVAACWTCNGARNDARQADPTVVSKEELWRRSRCYPRMMNHGLSGNVLHAVKSFLTRLAFWKPRATTDMASFSRSSTPMTSPAGALRGCSSPVNLPTPENS